MLRPRASRKNGDDLQPASAGHSSILQSISRFWLSILVIGLLLYAALLAIGRTDGFRDLVEQKVEGMTGLNVKIERAHIGFDLHVRIRNLKGSLSITNEVVALEVEKLTIRPSLIELVRETPWPVSSLSAENGVLRFHAADRGWKPMPEIAGAIAPWMNMAPASNTSGDAQSGILSTLLAKENRISIASSRVLFIDDARPEIPLALADGVTMESATLKPFEDRILWSRMKIHSMQNNGAEWMSDLELEWIREKDQDVILRIQKTHAAEPAALPPAPTAAP